MKYISYIISVVFCTLFFSSCSQDEQVDDRNPLGGLQIRLTVSNSLETRSIDTTPLTGENTISNVYVLMYKEGADNTEKPAYFYYKGDLSVEDSWEYTVMKMNLSELEKGVSYDVYVLASISKSLPETVLPNDEMTKGDLLVMNDYRCYCDDAPDAPLVSFTGHTTYVKTNEDDVLNIPLERTVARLDINITALPANISVSHVAIENAPSYAPFQKGNVRKEGTVSISHDNTASGLPYRFYIFENANKNNEELSLVVALKNDLTGLVYIKRVGLSVAGSIERNKIYKIEATLLPNSQLQLIVGIPISWELGGESNTSVPSKVDIEPKANSYIVPPKGKTIYIPMSQIDDANDYDHNISTLKIDEALTGELLWTDVKSTVTGKGIACDAPIQNIQILGKGKKALLAVTPGNKEGNAVIAVRGEDNTVKWSWHIWVTDFNPENVENQHVITEKNNAGTKDVDYIFMDRNLGAMCYEVEEYTNKGVGLYYQWGRKEPFAAKLTWPVSQVNPTAISLSAWYDVEGKLFAPSTLYSSVSTLDVLVKNPTQFITYLYLYSANDLELWGVKGYGTNDNGGNNLYKIVEKSVFDPCPYGWRITPKNAVQQMSIEKKMLIIITLLPMLVFW